MSAPARDDARDDNDWWLQSDLYFAASCWRDGHSTKQISVAMGRDESEVWNRLDAIKAMAGA